MSGKIFYCPLAPRCEWIFEVMDTKIPASALAGVFGEGVMTAIAKTKDLRHTEEALRIHMDSHSKLEYIQKIQELKSELCACG